MKLSKILLTAMIGASICTSCEPKTEKTVPNQPKAVVKDTIIKNVIEKDTLEREDTTKIPVENTEHSIFSGDRCPSCGKG